VSWALDHLVVAARRLDDGVAWCEAILGIAPSAGGSHPLMGTHNRVFAIGSRRFPRSYFEIIAIDPMAPAPGRTRWFDLDDSAMQVRLVQGPALVHWVARCANVRVACERLREAGIDRGQVLEAERDTPAGRLRWQITVRADGQRLFGGALPTLIEWGTTHPTDSLPHSGVVLHSLSVSGMPPPVSELLPEHVEGHSTASAPLVVTLDTPKGRVTLESVG
jgi:hypothetical protein